jgi:small subunit ribosomal protein S19e
MATIYDVPGDKYNEGLAGALKKIQEFKIPKWAGYVKTSPAKERPPQEDDWWYKRAASILRQLCIRGVIGVNRLRRRYGDRKNRGHKPEITMKGSGKIIRVILQQGEKAGLVKKSEGKRKGRELTEKGLNFLNSVAEELKNKIENGKDKENK